MKKVLSLLTAIPLALLLGCTTAALPLEETPAAPGVTVAEAGGAGATLPEAAEADQSGAIVILHTNDVHGAIDGYAKVAALKHAYEASGVYVLLLDAGDYIQGDTSVSLSEGRTAIDLMNAAGYDAAAVGNHEFDYGYENLAELKDVADFTMLAANVSYNGAPAFDANTVFTAPGGVTIGVFGLATPESATKAHPSKIRGVTFLSGEALYECAQAQVDELRAAGCDYVICLGHLGIDDESVGNRSLDVLEHVTGIDVFIDGHSHSTFDEVVAATGGTGKAGDAVLTSTGTGLAGIGVVTIEGGAIDAEVVATETLTDTDLIVALTAASIKADIEAEYGAPFAATEVELNGARDPGNRTEETNLGDLITDAMVWKANTLGEQVDGAVTNGGGIRAPIAAGDITKNDVNTVLPFGNTLSIVKITGAELLEALEASTYCTPTAIGGFPQVSGIEFTVDCGESFDAGELYPGGSTYHAPASINRVTIDSVGGRPFNEDDVYTIVTNDFMAAGGDTYYAFAATSVNYDLGTAMDEVVMEYITDVLGGTITAAQYGAPAGRITVEGAAPVSFVIIDLARAARTTRATL